MSVGTCSMAQPWATPGDTAPRLHLPCSAYIPAIIPGDRRGRKPRQHQQLTRGSISIWESSTGGRTLESSPGGRTLESGPWNSWGCSQ